MLGALFETFTVKVKTIDSYLNSANMPQSSATFIANNHPSVDKELQRKCGWPFMYKKVGILYRNVLYFDYLLIKYKFN